MSNVMSKEVEKTLSSVEEIPEDSLDQLIREGALDHCFEPREEFPKLYKPCLLYTSPSPRD